MQFIQYNLNFLPIFHIIVVPKFNYESLHLKHSIPSFEVFIRLYFYSDFNGFRSLKLTQIFQFSTMSAHRRTIKITLQGIKQINLSFCPFDRYAGTGEVR